MPRIEESRSQTATIKNSSVRAWWQAVTRLRLSLHQFTWLLLSTGVLVCLLGGCGSRRDSAFTQTPDPALVVTTLTGSDIQTVADLINLQATISRGCDLSTQRPLPARLKALVQGIRDQHHSRARDLEALVLLKNAPLPEVSPRHHEVWLEPFTSATSAAWTQTVVSFHRSSQVEALRLVRAAADHSPDPDVQAFARRQLPGIASTLEQMDHWDTGAH